MNGQRWLPSGRCCGQLAVVRPTAVTTRQSGGAGYALWNRLLGPVAFKSWHSCLPARQPVGVVPHSRIASVDQARLA
jgi:hypothetical protein